MVPPYRPTTCRRPSKERESSSRDSDVRTGRCGRRRLRRPGTYREGPATDAAAELQAARSAYEELGAHGLLAQLAERLAAVR